MPVAAFISGKPCSSLLHCERQETLLCRNPGWTSQSPGLPEGSRECTTSCRGRAPQPGSLFQLPSQLTPTLHCYHLKTTGLPLPGRLAPTLGRDLTVAVRPYSHGNQTGPGVQSGSRPLCPPPALPSAVPPAAAASAPGRLRLSARRAPRQRGEWTASSPAGNLKIKIKQREKK